MRLGLMQRSPLNISQILSHAARAHAETAIVSKVAGEPIWRSNYAQTEIRALRCAALLAHLGLEQGHCVSSLAWNNHRHFELFFAVPGSGVVLHTANPRLSDEHLFYTINDAGSSVLFYDKTLTEAVERIRPQLKTVEHYVVLSPEDYDERIGALAPMRWPVIDENSGAFLCYTSGTTGMPKGVLYSQRSVVLHALAAGLSGALGFSAFDVIMPCQSLYHATAWGLPFAGAINGAKFVLPGDRFDGASLHDLIQQEGVTFSGGVPTIWTMYLEHLARTGEAPTTLRRLVIGGSAVPRAMAETFEQRYGVQVQQLWGMTETSPLGVVSTPTPQIAALGTEAMKDILWTRQGRIQFGVELRIIGDDGSELAHDGLASGALQVRGPWVIDSYYKADASALDKDGWFDTGDVASIDAHGFMRITDRKKDVIKSGGEWISSIDLENIAAAAPSVKVAAVVGVFHPKWEERPILIIEAHEGETLSEAALVEWLSPKVPKWWLPDRIIFAPVPLTATGKIDKKRLRDEYKQCLSGASTAT